MTVKPGPRVSLPRWVCNGKIILGWRFGSGYYCLDCARKKGMGDQAGLDGDAFFTAATQDEEQSPFVVRVRRCSEACGTDLGESLEDPT